MKLKSIIKFLGLYGPQIWLIFFAANISIIIIIRALAAGQECLTVDQINADARCLYIYEGNIYNMGSRNSPHKNNPCGKDVTNIIPSGHISNPGKFLSPNLIGTVCSNSTTPSPSPRPTPTKTPNPTSNTKVGDVNNDGSVNIVDIGIIIDNYAKSPPINIKADINGDNIVNIVDIGLAVDNYGT